jgi:hypothetical protein
MFFGKTTSGFTGIISGLLLAVTSKLVTSLAASTNISFGNFEMNFAQKNNDVCT